MTTEDARYTAIYTEYAGKVLVYVRAQLRVSSLPAHLAEDILQDVFAVLWNKWHDNQYKTDEVLYQWLLNTAGKKIRETQRSEDSKEHENIDDHERDLRIHDGIDDAEERLNADAIWAEMKKHFDPQICQLLRLITDGHKYRECAEQMQIPLGTVCVLLHRFRKELKKPEKRQILERIMGLPLQEFLK